MAGFGASERLQFILSLDADGAIKGFQNVGDTADKELGKAESTLDKTGAGMTKFGTAAIAGAAVVGTALVGAASSFSDLGVEVSKFSDTTGFSLEASSRWIEVAGDMGVESGVLESSLNKMNKTAGATPEKFKEFGVEIAKTKDGAVDANGTFLNVVDRLNAITDPAKKAEAATALLGKGWTGMSELIATGSASLKTSLADVADAKVFDEDKVKKAKDYRAAMDTLTDSVKELALSIGQGAAPVIGTMAKGLGGLVDLFGKANAVTSGFAGQLLSIAAVGIGAVGALSAITGKLITMRSKFVEVGEDGERGLTKAGKAAAGLGVAMGVAAAAVAIYDLSQMQAKKNAEGFSSAVEGLTRATDEQAAESLPIMIAAWEQFNHLSPDQIVKKIATESLASAIHVRDLALGSEELRKTLAAEGVTVDMLSKAIDDETAAQAQATRAASDAQAKVDALSNSSDDLTSAQYATADAATRSADSYRDGAVATSQFSDALLNMVDRGAEAGERITGMDMALARLAVSTREEHSAYEDLILSIDKQEAWTRAQASIDLFHWKMADGSSAAEQQKQLLETERELANYVKSVEDIPPSKKTQIYALLDQGNIDAAQAVLDNLAKQREAKIRVSIGSGIYISASGTESSPGGGTLVGEQGPEIVDLPPGARVRNATRTAMDRAGGSSSGVVVQVIVQGSIVRESDFHRSVADALIDMVRRGELPAGAFN